MKANRFGSFIEQVAHRPATTGAFGRMLESLTSQPATLNEVNTFFSANSPPDEVCDLWLASRQTHLFEDVSLGQWGLILLPPERSAERTAAAQDLVPPDFRPDDVVVGEFRGDLDLLVFAPSEDGARRVLVALPLDRRQDWYAVGTSLLEFLNTYLAQGGAKYWEEGTAVAT